MSAQVVAGVCTQTPERQTQAREFRGLSTDPGHDPNAPQGMELHLWIQVVFTESPIAAMVEITTVVATARREVQVSPDRKP